MPKHRFHRERIVAIRDEYYPKGASAPTVTRTWWELDLTDEDKHHLAWTGAVRIVQEALTGKDREGLPISIPIEDTDSGGRILLPRALAGYQQCFDYFNECRAGAEADLGTLQVFHRYMLERFGQAPPMPKLTYE